MDEHGRKCSGITEIEKTEISYEWTIRNYNLHCKVTGESLTSPLFYSGKDDLKWNLALHPKGKDEKSNSFVSMFVHVQKKENGLKVMAQVTVSIMNRQNTLKNFNHLYENSEGYGYFQFVEQEYLLNESNRLLTNGTLTIVCKIVYSISNKVVTNNQETGVTSSQNQFSIYDDLSLLLENKKLTDVVLVTNGEEFHVHRAILAARSSVFSAMFESDMKETQENRVEIIDTSSDCVSSMLQYIYTGKVKNFDENSADLLRISDKYDIKGLRMMCEELLYKQVTLSNVIELLILADSCNCPSLKNRIIAFIVTHKNEIKTLSEFEAMKNSHPRLAVDIFSTVF